MTRFTVAGKTQGRDVQITWENGDLSGDEQTVARVKHESEIGEGIPIWTPEHVGPLTNHLSDPYQALALIKMTLGRTCRVVDGALPPIKPPPEGTVR